MIGYRLEYEDRSGSVFLGTNAKDISKAFHDEMESDIDVMTQVSLENMPVFKIIPFELSQEEIDNMPEFQGWL